jgi:hypothetical protein
MERKTIDYWILPGSLPDPRLSLEQRESSLFDSQQVPISNDDLNVAFDNEILTNTLQTIRTQTGL